jgi:hypothetical protein
MRRHQRPRCVRELGGQVGGSCSESACGARSAWTAETRPAHNRDTAAELSRRLSRPAVDGPARPPAACPQTSRSGRGAERARSKTRASPAQIPAPPLQPAPGQHRPARRRRSALRRRRPPGGSAGGAWTPARPGQRRSRATTGPPPAPGRPPRPPWPLRPGHLDRAPGGPRPGPPQRPSGPGWRARRHGAQRTPRPRTAYDGGPIAPLIVFPFLLR